MSEHDWEDLPLSEQEPLDVDAEDGDGNQVHVHVDLKFIFRVKSRRRCRRCGSESIDGEEPKDSCDQALARSVMES